MKIQLNGKMKQFDDVKTLDELIHTSVKNSSHVVAEMNGDIIKQPQWKNTFIKDGDRLELVSLVAGG